MFDGQKILTQEELNSVSPVVRFAPSPNGYLHLGHAYAALFSYRAAKAMNAKFLIRIEDTDTTRCNNHYEEQMLDDLNWLGVISDEWPLKQSNRFALYKEGLRSLNHMGVLFPSVLSRKELALIANAKEGHLGRPWPRDPDGSLLYPGIEQTLPIAEQRMKFAHPDGCALRLNLKKSLEVLAEKSINADEILWHEIGSGPAKETARTRAHPENWGDVILKRRDLDTSYHLSVVIDDALQGITHVIRGQDMFYATSLHRLLQELFGFPAPIYCHHPLVVDDTGRKLSKTDKDLAVKTLRERGWTQDDIINELEIPDFSTFQPD